MSYDLRDGTVHAWTAQQPASEMNRQGGQHRYVKGGPVVDGRKQILNPVGPGWRITPAARQLATRTEEFLPVGPGEATGLLDPVEIPLTNQWTQPVAADRGQVLAEIRDAITTPVEVLTSLDQWVEDGCPIDDQTTEGTDR